MPQRACRIDRSAFLSATGRGVRILVADSGVDTGHPALDGCEIPCWRAARVPDGRIAFVKAPPGDSYGHGTAVASIIRQLAPEAEIESASILGGDARSSSQTVLAGLHWAIRRGFDVVNCSFGSPCGDYVSAYKSAIDLAFRKNVLIVAACNNRDFRAPDYPASFPAVISTHFAKLDDPLGLLRQIGELVEFKARGADLRVAWKDGQYIRHTGSSFAAPHLTAMVARLRQAHRDWNACEMKAALYSLAETREP